MHAQILRRWDCLVTHQWARVISLFIHFHEQWTIHWHFTLKVGEIIAPYMFTTLAQTASFGLWIIYGKDPRFHDVRSMRVAVCWIVFDSLQLGWSEWLESDSTMEKTPRVRHECRLSRSRVYSSLFREWNACHTCGVFFIVKSLGSPESLRIEYNPVDLITRQACHYNSWEWAEQICLIYWRKCYTWKHIYNNFKMDWSSGIAYIKTAQ